MESEENHEADDNPSSATQLTEMSQSSDVLSLPSGNKLAEISIATDISDSEAEVDNSFLKVSMPSSSERSIGLPTLGQMGHHSKRAWDAVSRSGKIKNHADNGILVSDKKIPLSVPSKLSITSDTITDSLSLGDVKVTLQENGNLLSDRGFLNELLKSIDDKIAEDIPTENQNIHKTAPPTRDPGPSLTWKVLSERNSPNRMNEELFTVPRNMPQGRPSPREKAYSSQRQTGSEGEDQSINLKSLQISGEEEQESFRPGSALLGTALSQFAQKLTSSQQEWHKIPEKHVKFDKVQLEVMSDTDNETDTKRGRSKASAREENQEQPYVMQSAKILKDLANLRWTLNGWQGVEADPPSDHKSSLYFMQQLLNMLHVHQLQKQHADEELLKSQSELQRVSRELYVLREAHERRETRLREADSQLGLIQKEWLQAHEKLQNQLQSESIQTQCVTKERDALQNEVDLMKKDMTKMVDTIGAYQKSKYTLEETQAQLTTSRKQIIDVVEENSRLNKVLQEREKLLNEMELVKLPQVQQDLETAKKKNNESEKAHEQLVRDKAHLEDDLRLLHDQYKTLLEKVVEEEEKKEQAHKEKVNLEKQVEDLNAKMATVKQELHNYYQTRVEELVGQKSQSLQEQLNKLETNLKGSLADQLDAQRKSHQHAIANLQKSHEEEVKKVKAAQMSQLVQLQQEVKTLRTENQALQRQHQGIVTAVSSILGPNKENQLQGLRGSFPDVPWENGQISTSTPIGLGSASPLSEHLPSANFGMDYPIEHSNKIFPSTGSQGNDQFIQPSVGAFRMRSTSDVAPFTKPGSGARMASRPTSGNSSRGKSSRNSSRPTSGKSTRSGTSVPGIGLGRSSSSESDASMFQEGKQTVRQVVGGSLSALAGEKHPDSSEKVRAWKSGSDQVFMPLMGEYPEKNLLLQSQAEREYRSLPDLQMKAGYRGSYGEKMADKEGMLAEHLPREYQSSLGIGSGNENSKSNRRIHNQGVPSNSGKQTFGKKIYKASEILQSSDITDDEGMDMPVPSLTQVDQEMVKLLQELKTVRAESRTSESEAPTHDTSFDQDPASITLHKLSQVSTLLSQYVAQSPAS